jgi:hypothetical protein
MTVSKSGFEDNRWRRSSFQQRKTGAQAPALCSPANERERIPKHTKPPTQPLQLPMRTGIQFEQASVRLPESPLEVRFPCRRLRVSSRKMVRGRGRQSPPYSRCGAQSQPISLKGMCDGIIPPERTELCSVEVLPLPWNFRQPSTRQVNQNRLNLVMRWPSFMKQSLAQLVQDHTDGHLDEKVRRATLA